MSFVNAIDNPRRERCLPESNGIDALYWSSAELEDGDNGYWLETVDMAQAFDAEVNQHLFEEVDWVASKEMYLRLRKEADRLLSKARTPRQVYKVVEAIPPDFFEVEDELVANHTWFDGEPLRKGFYTIESKAESILKGFRFVERKQSTTVRVLTTERPISPVLAQKGGKILRALTAERLQHLMRSGFRIYTQEISL